VGVNHAHMLYYASMLNCEVVKISSTYLGMVVGGNIGRLGFGMELYIRLGKGWINGGESFYLW